MQVRQCGRRLCHINLALCELQRDACDLLVSPVLFCVGFRSSENPHHYIPELIPYFLQ